MKFKEIKVLLKYFIVFFSLIFAAYLVYSRWTPGQEIRDGRHDLGRNGIWIQHGWLGNDFWFSHNKKEYKKSYFRNSDQLQRLAVLFREHHITDIFPHLCPTYPTGRIPLVDPKQTELFLDIFQDFRVMPWVGGVLGTQVFLENPFWRNKFVVSVKKLFVAHPRLSGIHINIEPCPSGNREFLSLLEEIRNALPKEKILSVAGYPPPTLLHPFHDVHWDKTYFGSVAQRADQIAVMMYDTALRQQKMYQYLMASWTNEILDWTSPAQILLGVPTYKDQGVGYHDHKVENLENSLLGIHAGLQSYKSLPVNYQGIALYCEWEMEEVEWKLLREHFLKL